jgi:lipid-binding SYLF domain-containing protein
MARILILALLLLAGAPVAAARAQQEEQAVVDRAALAVQEILTIGDPEAVDQARSALQRARAVIACPRIFRAGFIIGGEGGRCVLAARDAAGSWSSPAFYALASASFGLQVGVQDMQAMMLVMNDRALRAVIDSQFKFGADASIAVATIGAGVEGAVTAAGGADMLVFARTRGAFAGLALEGSLLSVQSGSNRAYYGRDVGPVQILLTMEAYNPAADGLRSVLMRLGSAGPR